tara:strand:- start:233 stop:478 length:246 start_codon:yes stop_codon:yes gene_type:complete
MRDVRRAVLRATEVQQKRFGTAKARCTASGASTSRQTLNYTHRLLPKLLPLRCLLPCSPMTVTHCLPLAAAAMLACRAPTC